MKLINDRFWIKVDKGGVDSCWNWTAALSGSNGYGLFRISIKDGNMQAHRYSYELEYGSIPKGMLVCHTCDNPKCVNPKHLFLGTHKTNAKDRESKGRGANGNSKLSEKQAAAIKISSISQSKLAQKYNVSRRTIASIQYGETWKYLPHDINQKLETYCCMICNQQFTKTIHIDVNYKYRKISDELCLKCDKILKMFNNDILLFRKAILYLER